MTSNKPSGGVTPKLDKWPMSKLVWSWKNYFTAITDPILSECSWFCFPVAWISKMRKKKKRSKATSSHTPLTSNVIWCQMPARATGDLWACTSSLPKHAPARRFTEIYQWHRIASQWWSFNQDAAFTVFSWIFRTVASFCFPDWSEWVGHWVIPGCLPYTFPSRKQEEEGVTCNCQHLPTNNWGPNIEHKDSQSTLLRVKLLPAFGSGNLMPKGDTNKHWTNLKFEKCLRHRKSHSAPRLVVLMCCPEVRELCQRCDTVLYARWQWVAPRQYVGNVGNDGNVMWICFHNEFPMPSKAMDLVGAAVDVLDHFQLGEGTPWNTWLENADIKVSSGLFNADKLEAQ